MDILISDLVDIDFGRKPFRQQAQKGLIANNSLLRCAPIFLSRQEAFHGVGQRDRSRFGSKASQAHFHRMREREACSFELPKAGDRFTKL